METSVGGPTDALIGMLLDGRYRLESTIARGGMATVYVATDTRLDRAVAVKVMRPALAEDPDFVERFAREARAAARLSSPDVVAVHDQGTDAATRTAYLVMEHIEGRTLRDVIIDEGPLPAGKAVALLEPVLRALAAAHAAGLVHRDVKPENVLLGDDGRIKVADFGLARAIETSTLTATTGLLIGTVAYLAPEQVEHGRADTRTDVYAAGILLFELLTGAPPYSCDSPMSVAYRHVHEDVPAPSALVGGLPAALDELVVRATRRDPAARPLDAGAFLAELRTARQDVTPARPTSPTLVVPRGAVASPPALTSSPRRRLRRTAWVAALSVLLAAALAGGLYVGLGRYTSAPSVVGLSKVDAEAMLREAGLQVGYLPSAYNEDVPAQQIIDQNPDPSGRVRKGGTVVLLNSLGPDRRAVPSIIGSTRDVATAALERAGLKAGPVTTRFDARPSGVVVSSDPPSGEKLRPGASVALVISKGPELLAVPDVTGKPVADATTMLNAAGFKAEPTEVFSDTVRAGRVVSQAPADGQAVRDSAVRLQVSKGPELIAVPDLRGNTGPEASAALKALGLKGRPFDLPDGQGRVVTQSPRAGSRVKRGSAVTFYVL